MKDHEDILETLSTQNIKILSEFTGLPFQGVRNSIDPYKLNAFLYYDSQLHNFVSFRLWSYKVQYRSQNYSSLEQPETHPLCDIWKNAVVVEIAEKKSDADEVFFRLTIPGVNVREFPNKMNDLNDDFVSELSNEEKLSGDEEKDEGPAIRFILAILDAVLNSKSEREREMKLELISIETGKTTTADYITALPSKIDERDQEYERDVSILHNKFEKKLENFSTHDHKLEKILSMDDSTQTEKFFRTMTKKFIYLFNLYLNFATKSYTIKKYEQKNLELLKNLFSAIKLSTQRAEKEISLIRNKKKNFYFFYLELLKDQADFFEKIIINLHLQLNIELPVLYLSEFWIIKLNFYCYEIIIQPERVKIQELEELLIKIEYYLAEPNFADNSHRFFICHLYQAKLFLFLNSGNYSLALNQYDLLVRMFQKGTILLETFFQFLQANFYEILDLFYYLNFHQLLSTKELTHKLTYLKGIFKGEVRRATGAMKKHLKTTTDEDCFVNAIALSQRSLKVYSSCISLLDELLAKINSSSKKKVRNKARSDTIPARHVPIEKKPEPSPLSFNPMSRSTALLTSLPPPSVTVRVPQGVRDEAKKAKKEKYHSNHQIHQRRKSIPTIDEKADAKGDTYSPRVFTLYSRFTGEIYAIISEHLMQTLSPAKLDAIIKILAKGVIGFKNDEVPPVFEGEIKTYGLPSDVSYKVKGKVRTGGERGILLRTYGVWGTHKSYRCVIFKYDLENVHTGNQRVVKQRGKDLVKSAPLSIGK